MSPLNLISKLGAGARAGAEARARAEAEARAEARAETGASARARAQGVRVGRSQPTRTPNQTLLLKVGLAVAWPSSFAAF